MKYYLGLGLIGLLLTSCKNQTETTNSLIQIESSRKAISASAPTLSMEARASQRLIRSTEYLRKNLKVIGLSGTRWEPLEWTISSDQFDIRIPKSLDRIRITLTARTDSSLMNIFNMLVMNRIEQPQAFVLESTLIDNLGSNEQQFIPLGKTMVPHQVSRFVNLNGGNKKEQGSQRFRIEFLPTTLNGSIGQGFIRLVSPRFLRKFAVFRPNTIFNFIDVDTVMNLTPKHDEQLSELYHAGHRLWSIGLRFDATKPNYFEKRIKPVIERLNAHPILGKVDLSANLSNHYVKYCPEQLILDNGSEVKVRNCLNLFDSKNLLAKELREHLDGLLNTMDQLGARLKMIYLFDEVAGQGVPVLFQQQVYRYVQEKRPDLALHTNHSFYSGKEMRIIDGEEKWVGKLTDQVSTELASRHLHASTADTYSFSFYTIPRLRSNDNEAQVRLLKEMEVRGFLVKPWIKLLGTTTTPEPLPGKDPVNPCGRRQSYTWYKTYILTCQAMIELNEFSLQANQGFGFWAFFNAEPRTKPPSWIATLAFQERNFCENQYRAAVDFSRDWIGRTGIQSQSCELSNRK